MLLIKTNEERLAIRIRMTGITSTCVKAKF
jgi:hypothetical protein